MGVPGKNYLHLGVPRIGKGWESLAYSLISFENCL
jgi:hypothetical protein